MPHLQSAILWILIIYTCDIAMSSHGSIEGER
jgi:hypothetical protein